MQQLEEKNDKLTVHLDDLEQYGRRNSLRFHNVPVDTPQTETTDNMLVRIIDEKLSPTPAIDKDDIERSHLIGKPNDGRAQVICKFKGWKTKSAVYKLKSKLKHEKSTGPRTKLFISEDLTKPR